MDITGVGAKSRGSIINNMVMGERQYEFVAGFQTEAQGTAAQAL